MILWRCFAWSPRVLIASQVLLWLCLSSVVMRFVLRPHHLVDAAPQRLEQFRNTFAGVRADQQDSRGARARERFVVCLGAQQIGLPLALAAIELEDSAEVLDLDEPRTLTRERLRPSAVATRRREVTQPQALALHRARPQVVALRWWSTFEALWSNYTVFDRGAATLVARDVRELTIEDSAVVEAADLLGLRI